MSTPKVFISATSGDLRSVRQIVKEALLTINCHPVEQRNFEPDWRNVEGMLRAKIADCQAMVHIAGLRYGAEPDAATLPPGTPRRSYTQMEFAIGRQLQKERGEAGFRVYTFICPETFPFDAEPDVESEELRALQREHRQRLLDDPHLREKPRSKDELQARVLALQEQVFALRRQQEEARAEAVRTRRFGFKAFAIIVLLLALLGGGLWKMKLRQDALVAAQKMDAPALRARLAEGSERTLQADLASAAGEPRASERQRLRIAATAAHQARLSRIDDLANRLAELSAVGTASPVLVEMTRILRDESVEAALRYVDTQRDDLLAGLRAARETERQRTREKLQPLLQAAGLQASNGRNAEARKTYTQLLELEPAWPEALTAFGWFLRDQSVQAQSYGSLGTALADARNGLILALQLLALAPENATAQRLLCASLNQLGALATAQGDLAGALRHLTEAKNIAERLAASDPANAQWQRDLSVCLGKLGDLAISQGDRATALRYAKQELDIAERLAASDPANAQWQRDLAVSLVGLGELVTPGDLAGAKPYLTKGKDIADRLAAADPSNAELQRELSVALNKLGNLAVALGDPAGALRSFTESKRILERLAAADPTNAAWHYDLSLSLAKLGDLALAQRDLAGAWPYYSDAKVKAQRLAAAEPTNAEWQGGLAAALIKLGDLAKARDDLPTALGYGNQAHEIFVRLAASAADNAERQRDLSASLLRLGDLAVAQENPPAALRYFSEAKDIRERLAASDPANLAWQRDLSISLEKLGELAAAQGDLPAALRSFTESKTLRERLAGTDPANAAWQRDLWVAYAKLADHAEKANQPVEARNWWKKTLDTLAAMKQRGLQLSPEDAGILERLHKAIEN